MKRIILLITLIGLLSGCTQKQIDVILEPNVERTYDNKVRIRAKTNLPEGTKVMFDIKGQNGYHAQDEAEVSNGMVVSDEFTNNGKSLKPGDYTYEITTPIVNVQPENVQKVLGKNGKNMTGQLVKEDPVMGKTVYYTSTFNIVNKEDKEYKDWIKTHIMKVEIQILKFLNILKENGELKYSQELEQTLSQFEKLAEEALNKETNDVELQQIDEKYKVAMQEFKLMSLIEEGLIFSDNKLIVEGVSHFDKGTALFDEVKELLKK